MSIRAILIILSLIAVQCEAHLAKHFRKIENCTQSNPFYNIDGIYLINLDHRPEKLQATLEQLSPYGIIPCRIPAIYGWSLSPQALNDIGLKFSNEMTGDAWVLHYPLEGDGQAELEFLRPACEGKTYFSRWITRGAIGCTLSHLSILQHAYDAGYQTIWIMEDDVLINGNPLILSDLIDRLDALVGEEGWDVLYTDIDTANKPVYNAENNFETDLKGKLWFLWRPDILSYNMDNYRERQILSQDFLQIQSRMRTHSMIIRRSGMKKILDYEKEHGIFIPYDHELSFVPDIHLFSLRYPLITFIDRISDTQQQHFSNLED